MIHNILIIKSNNLVLDLSSLFLFSQNKYRFVLNDNGQ